MENSWTGYKIKKGSRVQRFKGKKQRKKKDERRKIKGGGGCRMRNKNT
jgi:hypothetical protein